MVQLILGAVFLSLVHALLPNHWLPFVAIAKSKKWSKKQTYLATFYGALVHVLSTILLGVFLGFLGYNMPDNQKLFFESLAPILLIFFGIWYIIQYLRKHKHEHESFSEKVAEGGFGKSMFSLLMLLFLSPCFEIAPFFLSAGVWGWGVVLVLALLYAFFTIAVMLLMVFLSLQSISAIKWQNFGKQIPLISGITLILLGIVSYFFV